MKALVLAAAALLMALGSISVGVNAQATALHKSGTVAAAKGGRAMNQPAHGAGLKDANGVFMKVMGD